MKSNQKPISNPALSPLRVVLTGGGSGGHITPILSLAQEIKAMAPKSKLIYIGQKGDSLVGDILNTKLIDDYYFIRAGKWRRYHGESVWSHIKDYRTVLLNIKDIFNVITGTIQAWIVLLRTKPNVIFIKGGFVGLPVGLSAKIRGISFITHDSDAVPGLTNRIIGRWAEHNAVGMPDGLYKYPRSKIIYTGVPVSKQFKQVSQKQKNDYRKQLGIGADDQVVFVVGGGLGARRLNNRILDIAKNLLADRTNLHILHITGKANYEDVFHAYKNALSPELFLKVRVLDFTDRLGMYSGSADVVIMRAGATNLAEMAIQGKACILVPNPQLSGGHQLKNVEYWSFSKAVKVYDEAEPAAKLGTILIRLLDSDSTRTKLENSIRQFARPTASRELAQLLINTAK